MNVIAPRAGLFRLCKMGGAGYRRRMRTVTYSGRSVNFPSLPRYESFFRLLETGGWEDDLFRLLETYVDPDTVYIDIGGWIGVTPFWAAQTARKTIVVEPDPVCLATLREVQALNPNADVVIIDAALSTTPTLQIGSIGQLGDSGTSALYASNDKSLVVPGVTLASLIDMADGAPVVIKIDIEGYEYQLLEQLKKLDPNQVKAVSLAFHPVQHGNSLDRRRFWRALADTRALVRSLDDRYTLQNPSALLGGLWRAIRWRGTRNEDLSFVSRRWPGQR